ncbi:MAG: hypothetical protein WGN25_11370 [Candidatus Electrothrix sp. GW3-4]|uniref:hypothetical protein n=1 Tax=Candidatus Electrothrix sp. GW3-4 TaxID=3126740 RepID=UPI0030D4A157
MILFNKIKCINFVLLLLLLSCSDTLAAGQEINWKNNFSLQLKRMAKSENAADVQDEMEATLLSHALSIDYDIAMPAVMELWFRNKVDIELIWWKQEDRATRSLILSLYPFSVSAESSRPRPIFWGPSFERNIKRFNSEEQQKRREELIFVREHLSDIAGVILEILELKTGKVEDDIIKQFKQIKERKIGVSL